MDHPNLGVAEHSSKIFHGLGKAFSRFDFLSHGGNDVFESDVFHLIGQDVECLNEGNSGLDHDGEQLKKRHLVFQADGTERLNAIIQSTIPIGQPVLRKIGLGDHVTFFSNFKHAHGIIKTGAQDGVFSERGSGGCSRFHKKLNYSIGRATRYTSLRVVKPCSAFKIPLCSKVVMPPLMAASSSSIDGLR
ncbi:MAG: hypothetical protein ACD_28C00369G0001 [uncultured bacterium]|nr:MAG: hypothetical protein ACD_28C00369G0001 [uncultured bacterium]